MWRTFVVAAVVLAAGWVIAGPNPIMVPGSLGITTSSEQLTFAADPGDASKTASGLVPDGAVLLGITTAITTTGTNCTSIDIGDGADVDMYADNSTLMAGDTTTGADATANWEVTNLAAGDVVITGVGGNCFGLVISVTAHYLLAN